MRLALIAVVNLRLGTASSLFDDILNIGRTAFTNLIDSERSKLKRHHDEWRNDLFNILHPQSKVHKNGGQSGLMLTVKSMPWKGKISDWHLNQLNTLFRSLMSVWSVTMTNIRRSSVDTQIRDSASSGVGAIEDSCGDYQIGLDELKSLEESICSDFIESLQRIESSFFEIDSFMNQLIDLSQSDSFNKEDVTDFWYKSFLLRMKYPGFESVFKQLESQKSSHANKEEKVEDSPIEFEI
jgi:hypothetical protein